MEESKRERVGRTLALSPYPRPFAIFSRSLFFVFSQLSEGLLQVIYVLHFQIFMVYIQLERRALLTLCYRSARERISSTNFSTPSRLRNCHFFSFLVFFLLFFLFQFLSFFFDVFFNSLLSLTPSPPNLHLLHTRGNGHFVLLQTIRLTIPRSWLTQRVRAAFWSERLCTD